MGQINMRDTRVEEVSQISSDSDSEEMGGVIKCGHAKRTKKPRPTVGIFPNHVQQGPTYVIFPPDADGKHEAAKWLYHMTVVSGGNPNKVGTHFEQLVQNIMEEEDGGRSSESAAWRQTLLVRTKEPLTSPLTTLTSERMQEEAVKLFKASLHS